MNSLLDFMTGNVLKSEGMAAAAADKAELLQIARDAADWVATYGNGYGTCTSDDVAMRMQMLGHKYGDLGNAAGSIFAGKKWRFTGDRVKSRRPSAHAREIKVWRLEQ
tara:strand:- start:129 stop:452 length:324 start_codon:yes stop_codon:yes gene_type:complete